MTPNSQSVQAHFEHDSDEIQEFIQDTEKTIATSSMEAVKAKLLQDHAGNLNSVRANLVKYCESKFAEFSQEIPTKRITRSGSKQTSKEKLVSDIISLVKCCSSKEDSVKSNDTFKISTVNSECTCGTSEGSCKQSETEKFTCTAELDAK